MSKAIQEMLTKEALFHDGDKVIMKTGEVLQVDGNAMWDDKTSSIFYVGMGYQMKLFYENDVKLYVSSWEKLKCKIKTFFFIY